MMRGLPDYYNPDTLVSQRLANVEEIVTHIRRVASLDNRGRTLYFDHFEEGIYGWYLAQAGDGSNPAACITEAEIAPLSMILSSGTLAGGGYSWCVKTFHIQNISRGGIEFAAAYYVDTPLINVNLWYDNGDNLINGQVQIDPDNQVIQVDDNGAWVDVVDLYAPPSAVNWLVIKMVIDFDESDYSRLVVGQEQYELSGYTPQIIASVREGELRMGISGQATDNLTNVGYIGHVALTVDEP